MTEDRSRLDDRSLPPVLFGAAAGLLLAAAGVAAMMVFDHFEALALPGCGAGGGCARATSSVWGKLPVINWPLSFVGLAYFLGMLGAWLVTRGRLPIGLAWMAYLGALGSLFLIGVMLVGQYVCAYCLTIHATNIAFVAIMAFGRVRATPSPLPGLLTAGIAAGLITGSLWHFDRGHRATIEQREGEELQASTDAMIEQHGNDESPDEPTGPGFTGRYRLGPETASIRVVVFGDYQCKDCRSIEHDMMAVFESRDDMSLSFKHFPFCQECNPWIPKDLHPNACWAARAAETAGILRDEDAFWGMHDWLFEREGSFTYDELRDHVTEEGYDFEAWSTTMQGNETLARVTADIDEAVDLGIRQTPLIFINGVELKGWRVQGAFAQAVTSLAATNPPARTAAADRPPNAADKAMQEWRDAAPSMLPPDPTSWPIGTPDGDVRVTVWGDYQEPYTAHVDAIVRGFMAGRDDVRYDFRHYPINQECNPVTTMTKHPQACLAHRAAEGAGRLGGRDAYVAMHVWLMENQAGLDAAQVTRAATALGLDATEFTNELNAETSAITEDATAAKTVGLRSVPRIYVNGKFVRNWKFAKVEALTPILEEAGQ